LHDAAAWRRWSRKLPRNRVRRARLRDALGRRIGYGPPEPVLEPRWPVFFGQLRQLPSGRCELALDDRGLAAMYRQARFPQASAELVQPLPVTAEEIDRWHTEVFQP
jgi:hypothetical protein